MKLLTPFLIIGTGLLMTACSAPNEYNTYDVNKKPSSYSLKNYKFWGSNDTEDNISVQNEEDMYAPIDVQPEQGRVH